MPVVAIVVVVMNLVLVGATVLVSSGILSWIGLDVVDVDAWSVFKPLWLLIHCFLLPMSGALVWLVDKLCKL